MDLDQQTLDALDWHSIVSALAEEARTPMGAAAALELVSLPDVESVEEVLDATAELQRFEAEGTWLGLNAVPDSEEVFQRAAIGAVLSKDDLKTAGKALTGLYDVSVSLLEADQDLPVLADRAPLLQINQRVRLALAQAFDQTGDLSARTYPALGELRQRIADLHITIRRTLDELVSGDSLGDALQDRFITQRGDRYVLPIKANFKRKDMGIVHGMSGSGQTAFVEPHQVVALNNSLRIAEGALEAEERRILTQLSSQVRQVSAPSIQAIKVLTWIDLIAARKGLAQRIEGARPTVGSDGVIDLQEVRHPVLALREVTVVPNDLSLDSEHPVLVISGPNTGGKTIALKTFGLCALMVRLGCFLPAAEGSRVDFFHDIVALIGDQQTVHDDHSSFSGHLAALSQMIERASAGRLYLVDEIASGTDPQQGAALAHAILEEWLARGPRAVITTHFHRLKTLSALDERFAIAGMQFAEGRPTYRLIAGASGESHAMAIAEHIGLAPDLVERARTLMGEGERQLAETLSALDEARATAEEYKRQAEDRVRSLKAQERRLAQKEAKITAKAKKLEEERAKQFIERLNKADRAVRAVVADLQRSPSHRKVDAAKQSLDALRGLVPMPEKKAPATAPPSTSLAAGDAVKVHTLGDKKGVVQEIKGNRVTVRVGSMVLTVKKNQVSPMRSNKPAKRPKIPPIRPSKPAARSTTPLGEALRYDANTLDLRGKRVDEALDATELFLDAQTMRGTQVAFILHGHGTGAMKQAIRKWLPSCAYVKRWQPANPDQGGDAYTVVGLR